MKEFLSNLITGAVAVIAVISFIIVAILGWGIAQGTTEFGVVPTGAVIVFIASFIFIIRRKGGWSDFWTNLFPWP